MIRDVFEPKQGYVFVFFTVLTRCGTKYNLLNGQLVYTIYAQIPIGKDMLKLPCPNPPETEPCSRDFPEASVEDLERAAGEIFGTF